MKQEVFLSDDFVENREKLEAGAWAHGRINFSWIRISICFFISISLLFCKHFSASNYEKIGIFYSENFKNNDERVTQMRESISDKIEGLRLKIKGKINHL